ncbi:hypothetical protein DFJ74DRAFT_112047 [Hyaloraphidium curvatum]|nr:hypothetical protein DFJ74DRAFT_112047 [Hyaloraphidium curvatum]
MDFLRSDCRVAFDVRHLNTLVTTVAHGGNYTAFLKLLHDCRTADAISAMDVYTVRLFLKAIAKAAANPAACEDLEGYPSRKTSVADLDTRAARDPLESEPEPEAALRAAILNGPEVQASDLYAPGMPPGSTTPVRKVIQLLSFVAARLEGRHADLVNNHITTGVIEAFLNAGHPRLARASVEVLAGEPFRIAPDAAHFNFLLKDAVERGDDRAADRLVWRWREAGVRPDRQLFNTTIGFYARAGRVDEARETLKEMKAAGIAPDELTGSHLLDGILAPGITVKDVELSLGWLAVNGIEITPKHQIKALRHFAELGDLDSMERIFADLPATPNSHAVATCAVAYAKHVDDERMFAFLGGVKKVQLPRSETWSAAIRALARRWAKTGDGEVGDLIFALINGVFDRKPVDPAAVSQGNRDFVLLGSEPPRPFPEFLQGIFSIARNSFTGDRLRILEEKGRAHLASEGYKVTPDMGAAEMLEAVERHPRLRGQSGSASD